MATLPDVTTANVGFIAYWNAINDGGVGSIKASDCLTDSNIQSYTLYDNGFTATYSSTNGRTVTARVKQDGWFVVYMDRTNQFTQNSSSRVHGYFDIINNWTDSHNNISSFPNNDLERAIHSLQSNLSNSGSVTYNSSDVGLYNYEYTSASTVTEMGTQLTHNTANSGQSPSSSHTSGLIYTSGTTLHYTSAQGSQSYGGNGGGGHVTFSGTNIVTNGDSPSSIDLTANGLIPNSQTEYDMVVQANAPAYGTGHSNGSVLILWS